MARNVATFTLADLTSLGRIDFENGLDASGVGFIGGDEITQDTATGIVMRTVLTNGSWAAGDAEGYIIFQRSSDVDFVATIGEPLDNGNGATADPTIIEMEGRFDGRFSSARYYVAFEHTPDVLPTGEPARLTGYSLTMLYANNGTSDIDAFGFVLAPNDELNVPIMSFPAGRRPEMRDASFGVYARWIDSTGKLLIFVVFQGIEGLGEGASTTVRDFAMSLLGGAAGLGECGDWVNFDLDDSAVTFQLAYETNDVGTPDDPTPPPGIPFVGAALFAHFTIQ